MQIARRATLAKIMATWQSLVPIATKHILYLRSVLLMGLTTPQDVHFRAIQVTLEGLDWLFRTTRNCQDRLGGGNAEKFLV